MHFLRELLLLVRRKPVKKRTNCIAAYQPPVIDIHPVGDFLWLHGDFLAAPESFDIDRIVVDFPMKNSAVESYIAYPNVLAHVASNERLLDLEVTLTGFRRAQRARELAKGAMRMLHRLRHFFVRIVAAHVIGRIATLRGAASVSLLRFAPEKDSAKNNVAGCKDEVGGLRKFHIVVTTLLPELFIRPHRRFEIMSFLPDRGV
jgi:hypothetical protein